MKVPLDHKIWVAWKALFNYQELEDQFAIASKVIQGVDEFRVDISGHIRHYERSYKKEARRSYT